MAKTRRISAILTASIVCFIILFSSYYITTSSHHHCIGEKCKVCFQINAYESALKSMSETVTTFAFAVGIAYTSLICLRLFFVDRCSESLITLKVLLLN